MYYLKIAIGVKKWTTNHYAARSPVITVSFGLFTGGDFDFPEFGGDVSFEAV